MKLSLVCFVFKFNFKFFNLQLLFADGMCARCVFQIPSRATRSIQLSWHCNLCCSARLHAACTCRHYLCSTAFQVCYKFLRTVPRIFFFLSQMSRKKRSDLFNFPRIRLLFEFHIYSSYSYVVKCDEFLALNKDQVIEIISSDHLTTAGEDKVCETQRK